MSELHLTPGPPRHVIVAGGGFAAVEALLALRALAGERVTLQLVAPQPVLRYRPSATGEPFGTDEVRTFDLARIAEQAGATHRRDALVSVTPRDHAVRLASGAVLRYDGLVLALGARSRLGIPGAVTFRDERDVHHMRRVVGELVDGRARRVVFAAPVGLGWTLPLYELALMTARALDDAEAFAEVALVTPEHRPLEVFGDEASDAIRDLLAARGVRLITRAHPEKATREGLALRFGGILPADHVVALPRVAGPRIDGIPGDWNGFVTTDGHGAVDGRPDVFCAGDMTDYPIKQGGLAAQEADEVARTIARQVGAPFVAAPQARVLRDRLAGERLYLRAELDDRGRAIPMSSSAGEDMPWWPSGKVVGRFLSPALADLAA